MNDDYYINCADESPQIDHAEGLESFRHYPILSSQIADVEEELQGSNNKKAGFYFWRTDAKRVIILRETAICRGRLAAIETSRSEG
jgi:hypothetical protein